MPMFQYLMAGLNALIIVEVLNYEAHAHLLIKNNTCTQGTIYVF